MGTSSDEPIPDAPTRPSLAELGFKPVIWKGWLATLGENDEIIAKLLKEHAQNSGVSDAS